MDKDYARIQSELCNNFKSSKLFYEETQQNLTTRISVRHFAISNEELLSCKSFYLCLHAHSKGQRENWPVQFLENVWFLIVGCK